MKRILFVDDEPAILSALKRSLRPYSGEWEMVFALGGMAALQELEKASFDVLVTDMRMPQMDGAQLLRAVHRHYPSTTRIVLSGYSEMESTLRAVPVAHQFLSKPCEPKLLAETIERTCALQVLMLKRNLLEAVGEVKALPSCPKQYLDLRQAMLQPDCSIQTIADIIQRDIAMSAKVLQLVNSSFFGMPRRIPSIPAVVSYLGSQTISSLVLGAETFRSFGSVQLPGGFTFEMLHRHAFLTACIAQRVMPNGVSAEDAYIAGMLNDIGLLVLSTKDLDKLSDTFDEARFGHETLYAVEQRRFGVSHAEVGAYLLGLWGLSYPVIEAVAHHHDPRRINHEKFGVLDAVHLATALAYESEPKAGLEPLHVEIDQELLRRLEISDDKLAEWRGMAAGMAAASAAA